MATSTLRGDCLVTELGGDEMRVDFAIDGWLRWWWRWMQAGWVRDSQVGLVAQVVPVLITVGDDVR